MKLNFILLLVVINFVAFDYVAAKVASEELRSRETFLQLFDSGVSRDSPLEVVAEEGPLMASGVVLDSIWNDDQCANHEDLPECWGRL
jgi:hypothetical protein